MKSSVFALVGGASTALAAIKGFNYGSQDNTQAKFESDFKTAASLQGTEGFNSARLYTMIQEGTTNTPIEAIQAAIDTKTTLLLGLWASEDQAAFNNELAALANAIKQYGSNLADLVVGISVGSEDLYRITPTGIENKSGYGQEPSVLVDYIGQVRKAIQGSVLSDKLVGHVDTWNAFTNSSNSAVIQACDFLGLDEYPYFQTADDNTIDNAGDLFFKAFDAVKDVAPGKQIWVTEAGWPVSGANSGKAVASTQNAETFWQDVFCKLESEGINTWWYTLNDNGASPSFSVSSNGQPLYDLSCKASSTSSSSSSSSASATSSSAASSGASSGTAKAGSSSSSSSSSSSDSSSAAASSGMTTVSVGGYNSTSGGSDSGAGSRGSAVASGVASTAAGSGTSSPTSSVSPSVNAAGKIQGGVAAVLMAAAAVFLL